MEWNTFCNGFIGNICTPTVWSLWQRKDREMTNLRSKANRFEPQVFAISMIVLSVTKSQLRSRNSVRCGILRTKRRTALSSIVLLCDKSGRLRLSISKSLFDWARALTVLEEIKSQRFKFSLRNFKQCLAKTSMGSSVTCVQLLRFRSSKLGQDRASARTIASTFHDLKSSLPGPWGWMRAKCLMYEPWRWLFTGDGTKCNFYKMAKERVPGTNQ